MTGERRGRIILLNGASSSGKSSVARALLPLLPDPWFLVPVDAIGAMRSAVHTGALTRAEVDQMLRRTRAGYHRVVAALAATGNDWPRARRSTRTATATSPSTPRGPAPRRRPA